MCDHSCGIRRYDHESGISPLTFVFRKLQLNKQKRVSSYKLDFASSSDKDISNDHVVVTHL